MKNTQLDFEDLVEKTRKEAISFSLYLILIEIICWIQYNLLLKLVSHLPFYFSSVTTKFLKIMCMAYIIFLLVNADL